VPVVCACGLCLWSVPVVCACGLCLWSVVCGLCLCLCLWSVAGNLTLRPLHLRAFALKRSEDVFAGASSAL
jgi:hypothetical protein